jgi:hypothetical protein
MLATWASFLTSMVPLAFCLLSVLGYNIQRKGQSWFGHFRSMPGHCQRVVVLLVHKLPARTNVAWEFATITARGPS